MSPRPYRLQRRAESAEETRTRIVRATLDLHRERGVLATSHRDIAERADVSVGTVYHHFPTQKTIVQACGALVRQQLPLPDPSSIDPAAPRRRRIAALARILVPLWARMPWLERLRSERDAVPALDAAISRREEAVRALIRRALGPRCTAKTVAVAEAVLDPVVVHRLLHSGMSQREAAATLASILNAWLEGGRP